MIKAAKDAAAAAAKAAKDKAAKVARDLLKQAKDAALKKVRDDILPKMIDDASWSPEEYRAFTLRIPEDFKGAQLDTSEFLRGYTENADAVTQRVMNYAFGHMAPQPKATVSARNDHWLEQHPTPLAEIAKLPNSPLSKYPFKAQYEADKCGYFAQPCNAVANGYFLSMFKMPEMRSTGNCGSASSGFAMDCIDEQHLLQIVAAGMPWGSWYMHGDGGSPLGGRLDNIGMDVEFYYIYRLMIKNFVHDDTLRAQLVMPGCTQAVPAESDGIKWVNAHGEKMCHLYWARMFKKAMTDEALLKKPEDASKLNQMMIGVPNKEFSIAGFILITLRAVFHKKFPAGDEIYGKLTAKIVDTLMAKAKPDERAAIKDFAALLDADKIFGLENPHDGIGAVLDIFSDFLDAMFWNENGQMGPGAFALRDKSSATAGCTWQPHSCWHRKATRVISGFINAAVGLKAAGKLKKPQEMREIALCGVKPCGLWIEIVSSIDDIIKGVVKVFNMKRLLSKDMRQEKGGTDLIGIDELFRTIKAKWGDGWPKVGAFPANKGLEDKWPSCAKASHGISHKIKIRSAAKPSTPTDSGRCKNETVSLEPCQDLFAKLSHAKANTTEQLATAAAGGCSTECSATLKAFVKTCTFETMPAKAQAKMTGVASVCSNGDSPATELPVLMTPSPLPLSCRECVASGRSWQVGQCNPGRACAVSDVACFETAASCADVGKAEVSPLAPIGEAEPPVGVCCMAMTKECLACKQGTSVDEFCEAAANAAYCGDDPEPKPTAQPEPPIAQPEVEAGPTSTTGCTMNPCLPVCKKSMKDQTDDGKPTTPHMVLRCAPDKDCLAANAKCAQSVRQRQKVLNSKLSSSLKDYTHGAAVAEKH